MLAGTSSGKENGLASGTGSKPTIKKEDLEKARPPIWRLIKYVEL